MSQPPRVVLHTDMVVMALTGQKDHSCLKQYWGEGRIIPIASPATAEDLLLTLRRPRFGLTPEEAELAAESYLRHREMVEAPPPAS